MQQYIHPSPNMTRPSPTRSKEHSTLAAYPLCRVVENKSSNEGEREPPTSSIREVTFIGTCFAISPVIVLTTAHTYFAKTDIVENFGVAAGMHHRALGVRPSDEIVARSDAGRRHGRKRPRDVVQRHVGAVTVQETGECHDDDSSHKSGPLVTSPSSAQGDTKRHPRTTEILLLSRAAYLQASNGFDALILWLDRPLPYHIPLRGWFPVLHSPIVTAWYHQSFTEHALMTTSGTTTAVSSVFCSASGCVTDKGSSGAPVLCAKTGVLLGMHLGSNIDASGVRHTEFIPARTLLELMVAAGVQTRLPHYSVSS